MHIRSKPCLSNLQSKCADHRYRYRPSSNGAYSMNHSSPTPGSQIMYPYGTLPVQGQQQSQPIQHMSRPSPPQPTWAVPQTHNSYYQMPRGQIMNSREDSRHSLARPDATSGQSPALSSVTYSSAMHGPGTLATTDYFPGVIDTSKLASLHVLEDFADSL
jgi:hypothetical protein